MAVTEAQVKLWLKNNTAKRRVLVEVGVRVGGVEVTRYLSNKGYRTGASDVPANTNYISCISSGVTFTESISLEGVARPLSSGVIAVDNTDGSFDSWYSDVWQGRPIKIFIGDYSWPRADFYQIFGGVIAKADCTSREQFELVVSDKLQRLNTTVSDVKVGGVSSNKDKLKPLLFGQCHNISPVLINLATLEYQIHNGPIDSIIEVRDNGVPVLYTPNLAQGTFALNQQPVGTITCSARGDTPTTYANDAVSLIKRLVKDYGLVGQRFIDSDLDLTALSAFQTLHTQPLGIYLTEKSNVVEVCNRIASSIGARMLVTRKGLLTLVKVDLPQSSAGTSITKADIEEMSIYVKELTPVQAAIKIGYCKNWTPQEALQTGIPANHVELFAEEWLTTTVTNSTAANNYKLFTDPEMLETLLLTASLADAEANRLLSLWSTQRRVISYKGLPHLLLETLGSSQTITNNRFGLAAGVTGQIISITTDWLNAKIEMDVLL